MVRRMVEMKFEGFIDFVFERYGKEFGFKFED